MTNPRLADTTEAVGVQPHLSWSTLSTVFRFEFLMATRSRVAWLAISPLLLIALLAALTSHDVLDSASSAPRIGSCALLISMFVSLGVGVAMTDRLVRFHGLGLDELMLALPCRPAVRLVGGFLGSLVAMLAPSAAALILVGVVLTLVDRDPWAVPSAALAFLIVVAPAAALVGVASAVAGLLMPVPLARALTVIGWFWATLFNRSLIPIPTPTGTVLSPLGDYAAAAWWQVTPLWAGRGQPPLLSPDPAPASATINLLVVIAATVILVAVAHGLAMMRARSAKSA